ncbi:MAG: hypothetical protein DMF54_16820, partial [Acidobacteria bacterium]
MTVTNTQGPGFILIYPQGAAQPTVSTVNYVAGQTIANAAVVPLSAGGAVTIIAGVSGTDLVLDTNGYYSETTTGSRLASGEFLAIFGARGGGAVILGENNSSLLLSSGVSGINLSATGVTYGVVGQARSTTAGAAGVIGYNALGGLGTHGVQGAGSPDNDAAGIFGHDGFLAGGSGKLSAGVRGESQFHFGVLGESQFAGTTGELLNGSGAFQV